MGGRGDYYDRDVTNRLLRNSSGVSTTAERELQQRSIDPLLLPKDRRIVCTAKNPLVYDFDVTGSMDVLPKIIWDKWPGIVGQIVARKYLPDPEMSITATGDVRSDRSPLQMCDFSPLRNLDRWLKRIHFEKGDGGQGSESYEITAYYYLNFFDMPRAENAIYLITGDEACVNYIYARDLEEHFGGKHSDTTAKEIFSKLLEKFKGNVIRIQRKYEGEGGDGWTHNKIVEQWKELIGEERIIHLPEDLAIGDVTLGIYAILSGARTLDQYIEDMRTRPLDLGKDVRYEPQSETRISQVERALRSLKYFVPPKPKSNTKKRGEPTYKKTKSKSWKL